MKRIRAIATARFLLIVMGLVALSSAQAQEPLFEYVGPPDAVELPDHAIAGQDVRINRRALLSASLLIELFGESFVATRTHTDRSTAGQLVWTGYLQGDPGDTVILTLRGNAISGFIQYGLETYRIGGSSAADNRLYMLDLQLLPPDDSGGVPDGGGSATTSTSQATSADGNTVQDLLVVYNQAACNSADSSGDCAQLEADIVTAVADINAAYTASGVNITMNLAGTHKTVYTGTSSSQALSDIRGTTDGQMDEVHGVRDDVGADIVAFIYDGEGCGRGYLSSSASYGLQRDRRALPGGQPHHGPRDRPQPGRTSRPADRGRRQHRGLQLRVPTVRRWVRGRFRLTLLPHLHVLSLFQFTPGGACLQPRCELPRRPTGRGPRRGPGEGRLQCPYPERIGGLHGGIP